MGKALDAAMEYFRCIRESDVDGMERIYAPHAVLALFNGTTARGPREIRDFYDTTGMRNGISPHPQEPIEDGNRCVVEIVVGLKDGRYTRVVDIFTVNNDGLITSLRIYHGVLLDEDVPTTSAT
jgi:hypothetical protein